MPRTRINIEEAEDTLGRCVRVKLAERGWRDKDLAERLNIDNSTLSKMMSGKTECSLKRLRQIADIFKCPISELYIDRRRTA